MTKLLVSVRSLAEARLALAAGVDLIDLKEPARGSLGALDPAVARQIVRSLRGRVPLSAALGELLELRSGGLRLPAGVSFAKLGLAGCASVANWPRAWQRAIERLGPQVTPVAVIYADWPRVAAPDPQQVFDHAVRLRAGALLIDTCLKSGDDLLVHAGPGQLQAWIEAARRQSMPSVIAGSLSPATIRRLLPLGPEYIAVRGAACRGSRAGPLDGRRLECLVDLVRGPRRAAAERFA
jgi:uncharacterized protein (UPF0264 family)